MNTTKGVVERIKMGLGIALLAASTGCLGVVDGGYGYEGPVFLPGPEFFLFGGGFDRGRDVHRYSHRGSESRRVAHPGGGHERRP